MQEFFFKAGILMCMLSCIFLVRKSYIEKDIGYMLIVIFIAIMSTTVANTFVGSIMMVVTFVDYIMEE